MWYVKLPASKAQENIQTLKVNENKGEKDTVKLDQQF